MELKRRNVYKVAVTYGVVAFVGFQAATLLIPRTILPSWADELLLAFMIAGFPVALVIAWAFELTPDGVRRASPPRTGKVTSGPGSEAGRGGRRRAILAGALLAVVSGLGGYALLAPKGRSGAAAGEIRSIAVLPLENLSGNPTNDYFSAGMTDQLITELAQLRDLLVISRSAVVRYRERPKPIREIADELNVEAVIEGSVLRVGDEVRVTAQLIDGETEAHLWARDYVRDVRELLAVQKDVARAIVEEIRGQLTPEDAVRLEGGRTVEPAAQEAFLRGVYFQRRFQDGGESLGILERSVELLQRAVEVEPDWARAHAERARAYLWRASYRESPGDFERSKAAAREAIRLDGSVADAYGALGFVLHRYDLDWAEAERAYRRALELSPNSDYRWGYGLLLMSAGRYDEAVTNLRMGLERAPLSSILASQVGWALGCGGRYEEAARALGELLDRDPDYWPALRNMGAVRLRQGRTEEALGYYRRAVERSDGSVHSLAALAYAYARTERTGEAEKILEDLEQRGASGIPAVYAVLGRTDDAVDQLEGAYAERQGSLRYLRCFRQAAFADLTALEGLRQDPRFLDLLDRIDYPET